MVAEPCPENQREALQEFQNKIYGYGKYKDTPKLCVDTSKLHIQGEPQTRTEASVTIQLEIHPDI